MRLGIFAIREDPQGVGRRRRTFLGFVQTLVDGATNAITSWLSAQLYTIITPIDAIYKRRVAP
ncbi:hypothetical protein KL86PLE_90026 [uncultured Pleomorphomonas sp.]|uniref:Uncharacterized protein n=1 Tax=uncultured Pleomorphomonas sp. TaxID=442121 RepID=A0A212LME6_9HYPH|nr:hypothetical protein KL86PLE_90026 [uncultured Pleomorphomonas sp.]